MAYDPKKSRAKQKDEDVVDEILKEDKPKAKKTPTKKPAAKKPAVKKPEPSLKIVKDEDELEKIHAEDAPLIMQPQVWVTLAASAIVALLVIKKRRKK